MKNLVVGKYTNKNLSNKEALIAKKLLNTHSSLIPITISDLTHLWDFNLKDNQIVIPFDLLDYKILFEKVDPLNYRFLKRPDYIIAEINENNIVLRAVDSKSYNLENKSSNIGQISALNLNSLISNSPFLKENYKFPKNASPEQKKEIIPNSRPLIGALDELIRRFPDKKIKLKDGEFIVYKRKQETASVKKYLSDFFKTKGIENGTLNIENNEIYLTQNKGDLLKIFGEFDSEIISVERFHNDISKIKNFIAKKGYYHTSAIAISGFNEIGEPIMRFEYSQISGVQTYAPDLEEIDGIIDTINSWSVKNIFNEQKKIEEKYFNLLRQRKFEAENSITKLEERIGKILKSIEKNNQVLVNNSYEKESLTKNYENKLKVFTQIEKILTSPLSKKQSLDDYIEALTTLSQYYQIKETDYNEQLEKLKKANKTQDYETKNYALAGTIRIFNFMFPDLKPLGATKNTIPGIHFLVSNLKREYKNEMHNLDLNEKIAEEKLEGTTFLNHSLIKEKETLNSKIVSIEQEKNNNTKQYQIIKNLLNNQNRLISFQDWSSLYTNLTSYLMNNRRISKENKEILSKLEERVQPTQSHEIVDFGLEKYNQKKQDMRDLIVKTIDEQILKLKRNYTSSYNRYRRQIYDLKQKGESDDSLIDKINARKERFFKELSNYQEIKKSFILNQESKTLHLRDQFSLKRDEYKRIRKQIKTVKGFEEKSLLISQMKDFINLSFPLFESQKKQTIFSSLNTIIDNIHLDDQKYYNSIINYHQSKLLKLNELPETILNKDMGLYSIFEKYQQKYQNKLEELNKLKLFINKEKEKYYGKFDYQFLKNNYKLYSSMKDELINKQKEIKRSALKVIRSGQLVLTKKHKARKEYDVILNKKIQQFNNSLKYEILPSNELFTPLVVYLDLDSQRKEVCKLTFYNYKTIDQI